MQIGMIKDYYKAKVLWIKLARCTIVKTLNIINLKIYDIKEKNYVAKMRINK